MEGLVSPISQKTSRKCANQSKDLWLVVREGSVPDVDSALVMLQKNGGNINARNLFGLTPLHIATWRNHIAVVRRLLEEGADPNARDGESGWSSLHRALHFGHLAVACVLLQFGASLTLGDSKSRTPVDLLSGPVLQAIGNDNSLVNTEVFSWGSGVNYQLGTGNAHIQKLPCKVESLHGSFIKSISAAKFHSVAVSARGEVYTWGFGRGGRLGHPDFDIHSGQAAVITPRQVTMGLGARRVKAVAAAKHHTVVVTEGGEVFTWGSNREGQLGYTSVDSQPTPRRVSSLKARIMAVSAANKHTAVVSEAGEIYTWGCNREGQLGYGTSNSASNYSPRVVAYLKGKHLVGVSAAKYHTIVLGSDGEVFTWGHRLVNPRRVTIARNIKKAGNTVLKFHRKERLTVVAIAAGMTHSIALTDDGSLFYWSSSDPELQCLQLHSLCGKGIASISAGKYWTAAVTVTGDTYMWDGKKGQDSPPTPARLHGVKKATSVSVGETHLLIVSSLYHPGFLPQFAGGSPKQKVKAELDELREDFMFDDVENEDVFSNMKDDIEYSALPRSRNSYEKPSIPSLKSLCEKVAAEHLVEPRNAIQVLEIADSLGADDLKRYCEEIVIRNLDYILAVAVQTFIGTSFDILIDLEKLLDLKSSEPWSCRQLPTPTAKFPAILNSEDENVEDDTLRTRNDGTEGLNFCNEGTRRLDGFLQSDDAAVEGVHKRIRALRKKLQQIELLEEKQSRGHLLDGQQISKLVMRSALENSLAELGSPIETVHTKASSVVDERGSRKAESRKQRRKNKGKAAQKEEGSSKLAIDSEPGIVKGFLDAEVREETNKVQEKAANSGNFVAIHGTRIPESHSKKAVNIPLDATASPTASKKKNRKGGLSMFLSGALDDVPKSVAPPPPVVMPKSEGPAWGGAKASQGSKSLRIIQDEQSKTETKPTKKKESEDHAEGNNGKLPQRSIICSSPIAMAPARKASLPDGDGNTPSWAASGTPPSLSRPSLRDIQFQQGKKQQLGVSHSPQNSTTGFSVMNGLGSPSESAGLNRWFKPEVDAPSSIRSIQMEERAIKDLKRFYSNVRIVKNQL
ncbi:uncharacterized protein LOC121798950 [Salvia splendens]|uniref:uncharacterized protein LOC121798950 n=1 Tax=Salvia splendens TaxID=180675 RepID=UPI001103B22F|nr:uncharacterized protein LOC121798950 [Salvia splendens]